MSGEPWFRFFPSDWLSGVSGLTAAERGVYMTLLAMMYDHGEAIERNDGRLSRQCGLPKVGFVRALDGLISTGKILVEEGRLTNSRVKNELSERENRTRTASNNAQSRWQKPQQNQHTKDATALPTQCEPDASRAPVPQPQPQPEKKEEGKPSSILCAIPGPNERALSRQADEFYAAYPKKINPNDAKAKFIRAARGGADPVAIIDAATRFAEAHRKAGTDKQFIPAPAVWLHKGGYLSEDLPEARAGPNGFHPAAPRERPPTRFEQMTQDLIYGKTRNIFDGEDRNGSEKVIDGSFSVLSERAG